MNWSPSKNGRSNDTALKNAWNLQYVVSLFASLSVCVFEQKPMGSSDQSPYICSHTKPAYLSHVAVSKFFCRLLSGEKTTGSKISFLLSVPDASISSLVSDPSFPGFVSQSCYESGDMCLAKCGMNCQKYFKARCTL